MSKILKDVHVLKKVQRSPEKFDALNVFAVWAQRHGVPMRQADAVPRFAEFLQGALKESIQSDTMLFGGRTQAMFDAVVANLGAVKLVKSEDCGDIYTSDGALKIPDTRIALADGRNVLVEVKNNAGDWRKPFRLKAAYLEALSRYAELARAELRIAVYWRDTATWTLVRPDIFKDAGRDRALHFTDAFTHNDMGALGDMFIGCRPPVVLQAYVAKEKGGAIRFVHPRSRVFAGGTEVLGEAAKHLMRFMIFYGGRTMTAPKLLEESGEHRVVEVQSDPEELDEQPAGQDEGCRFDSLLSSMLSRYWLQTTSTWEGELAGLLPRLGAWNDQLLNVGKIEAGYFALVRFRSSLDAQENEREVPTAPLSRPT